MFTPAITELSEYFVLGQPVAPLLRRLLAIGNGQPRIVSAYLRLDTPDRNRQGCLIALKDEIRSLQADPDFADLDHLAREEVGRDLDRVVHVAEHAVAHSPVPALGVFAWDGGRLLEAVQLPGVPRTRLVLDRIPRVRELLAAEPVTRPVLTLLVDRAHARVFEVTWLEATELPGIVAPATRGGKFHSQRLDAPGWGERDFHGRLDEERRHQHAEIVEALEPVVKRLSPQGILLAGPKDHTSALGADFPEDLASLLLGEVKLNPTAATPADVKRATLPLADAARRRATARVIRSLQEAAGHGLAVEGAQETLRAFFRGQVRTLLVPEEGGGSGFRCAATGRLVLSREECRGEGEPRLVRDILDEVVEGALRQHIDVLPLHGPAARELLDGVGALLRYR